jgi:septal ring factor EnvC (AmiA/AmiB activator)
MADALDLRRAAEEIISSYEERFQSINSIFDNTQMVLGEFQESISNTNHERETLKVQLRDTLAKNESLRKKDFDLMMNAILLSQDDREREVRSLLSNYLMEQKDMARQLKENLGSFKDGLNKDNIDRINEFRGMLKDILRKQEERKGEVTDKLKMFQKEQGELAHTLEELLSKGRELRIRDLKTMLRQFEAHSRERAARQRERREDVQKILSVFRGRRRESSCSQIT